MAAVVVVAAVVEMKIKVLGGDGDAVGLENPLNC